jgi:hypothetical protein
MLLFLHMISGCCEHDEYEPKNKGVNRRSEGDVERDAVGGVSWRFV